MPTERKRAIRSSAGWAANQAAMEAEYGVGNYYTTLSAWEAGEQANLTTLDEIRTAVCYHDWPTGLSDELDINGWTTDATRYARVTVAAGHRHTGTPGTGFHLRKASSGSTLVMIRHGYSRIEWVDAVQQSTADPKFCFRAYTAPSVLFYACLGKNQTTSTSSHCFYADAGGSFVARLCLAYGSKLGFQQGAVYTNCVAASCDVGYGNSSTSGAGTSKNCIAYNCTTRGFSTVWNFNGTCSNDASSDTSAGWTGCVTGITSAAFVNAAGNDFHLSAGSVLRGAGVNLYSDFQTDIDGDAWLSSGAWDIGFDYYVAAGGVTLNIAASGAATATGTATAAAQVALAGVGVSLASGSAALAGSKPLAASGASTASGTAKPSATKPLSASGSSAASASAAVKLDIAVAGVGVALVTGAASITGGSAGAIQAAGSATATGSAATAAQVKLSAIGLAVSSGSAAVSSGTAGDLSAAGSAQAGGSASPVTTVTISAAGLAQAAGAAGLSVAVLLAGAGAARSAGNAVLAAQLAAMASGAAQAGGSATLSAGSAGSLDASGAAFASGAAALKLTVRLAGIAAAQSSGAATLEGGTAGEIRAQGAAQAAGTATASADVVLTAAGFVRAMGVGAVVLQIPLAAFGAASATGAAVIYQPPSLLRLAARVRPVGSVVASVIHV